MFTTCRIRISGLALNLRLMGLPQYCLRVGRPILVKVVLFYLGGRGHPQNGAMPSFFLNSKSSMLGLCTLNVEICIFGYQSCLYFLRTLVICMYYLPMFLILKNAQNFVQFLVLCHLYKVFSKDICISTLPKSNVYPFCLSHMYILFTTGI